MNNKSITRRVDELESIIGVDSLFDELYPLLDNHTYYDTLSDHQKNLYCAYVGFDRKLIEEIQLLVLNDLHFQIAPKRPLPMPIKQEEIAQEVERIVLYDSKKEKAIE